MDDMAKIVLRAVGITCASVYVCYILVAAFVLPQEAWNQMNGSPPVILYLIVVSMWSFALYWILTLADCALADCAKK